jgi:hypothetical protein
VERLEESGDRQLLAYAQLIVANMARLHGALAEGLEAIGAAVRSYAELDYVLPLREARHLEVLLLTELGRLDEAADRLQAQLGEAERTGSSPGRFFATLGLAEVQARRGDSGRPTRHSSRWPSTRSSTGPRREGLAAGRADQGGGATGPRSRLPGAHRPVRCWPRWAATTMPS